MMPPECKLCGKRFDPTLGGLVHFLRTQQDQDWYDRAESEPGFVGHPPNAVWFCENHIEAAQKRAHLKKANALRELQNLYTI